MQKQEYTVEPVDAGKRLDLFLTGVMPDATRSQIQKLIKQGAVLVNGEPVAVHHFLKTSDHIQITEPQAEKQAQEPHVDFVPAHIVAEEPDFIIVNKPAGLLVHPKEHGHESTLVDQILELFPEIRQVGEDPMRPGIVHRLDREVCGVMVVARTWEMYEHLKAQFLERSVHKEYRAIVHGVPAKTEGEMTFSIERSSRRSGRMAAKPEHEGKRAITAYEVLEAFPNYAYLKLTPKTGRMHQIRAHCMALGHPIVGDALYHTAQRRKELGALRPLLASVRLEFLDRTGKRREFSVPLPEDMENTLVHLRGAASKR